MAGGVIEELDARGLIEQISDPDAREYLATERATVYCGFDPTATSLQLGNLVPVMGLARFQRAGHRVLVLVGGATGLIGDPSGKSAERNLLTAEQVERNCAAIRAQLERFLDFEGPNAATIVNNHDWIGPMSFIDWLRDVGKHFTINTMLAKDSVKSRLAGEAGISFTEFSYMTMQAYDFYHLHRTQGCKVQYGGNDQWGNITAGIELVRRKTGERVFGVTVPLLTTATGEKLGKSAGNALYIDPEMTSPYLFYQYWMNAEDADVGRFLRIFSFLSLEEIDALATEHMSAPERRAGQRRLAEEVTRLVHGEAGLAAAQAATQALFGGDLSALSERDLLAIFADVPTAELPRARLESGLTAVDVAAESGLAASRSEAKRMVKQGALNINNRRVEDEARALTAADLLGSSLLVLRMGKKQYRLVRFV